jgi:hypothetical protein
VEDAGRGDAGFLPAVRDGGQDLGGEAEDLFGIGEQAAKNGSGLPFLEPFPFQFRNFFDHLLHEPIVVHGLTDALLPSLGDADLAQLAGVALNQVQGLVQFAFGAVAIGFAAPAGAFRQGAAKKPLAGGQLGDAGAEAAFGGGEFGAVQGVGHDLYLYTIQDNRENQEKTHNADLLLKPGEAKTEAESSVSDR